MTDLPSKPGWYWDPDELYYNEEVLRRWRTEFIVSDSPCYRLRRWDGKGWTDERIDTYVARGRIPHLAGPGKRIQAFTDEQTSNNLRVWLFLMVGFTLFGIVGLLLQSIAARS